MVEKISLKEVIRMSGMTRYKIMQAKNNGEILGEKVKLTTGEGWEFDKDNVVGWLHLKGDKIAKKRHVQKKGNLEDDDNLKDKIYELELKLAKAEAENLAKENLLNEIKNQRDEYKQNWNQTMALLPKQTNSKRKRFLGLF